MVHLLKQIKRHEYFLISNPKNIDDLCNLGDINCFYFEIMYQSTRDFKKMGANF